MAIDNASSAPMPEAPMPDRVGAPSVVGVVPPEVLPPPQWRGRLHTWAFAAALPLGALLVLLAERPAARIAVAIYATCLAAGFGGSAAYHRLARSTVARRRLRRLDHSLIFLVIAGTYTPVCVLALPERWGTPLLVTVWVGAAAGVVLKNLRRDSRIADALYLLLGWAAVLAGPAVVEHMPAAALILAFCGGVTYTVGATVLFRRRPDPSPTHFGYHEVWHACTIAASGCHFAMVCLLVASAGAAS